MTKTKSNARSKKQTTGAKSRRMRLRTEVPMFNQKSSIAVKVSHDDLASTCSMTNPFSPCARGSKIPDVDSSKSVPVTVVQSGFITSLDGNADGNGDVAIAQVNGIVNGYIKLPTAVNSATGVVTTWGAPVAVSDYTAYATQFSTYRVVSWGVRVFNSQAPLNRTGKIRICTVPNDTPNGQTFFGSLFEEVVDIPIDSEHVYWISKPIGNEYLEYKSFGSIATAFNEYDRMLIAASGLTSAPGAPVLAYEVIYNIECQVVISSVASSVASPAATYKPHVMEAAGHVHNAHNNTSHNNPSFLGALGSMAKMALLRVAGGVLDRGSNMASQYISNGGRPSLPMLMN